MFSVQALLRLMHLLVVEDGSLGELWHLFRLAQQAPQLVLVVENL